MLQNIIDSNVPVRALALALPAMLLAAGLSRFSNLTLDVIPEFPCKALRASAEAPGYSAVEVFVSPETHWLKAPKMVQKRMVHALSKLSSPPILLPQLLPARLWLSTRVLTLDSADFPG